MVVVMRPSAYRNYTRCVKHLISTKIEWWKDLHLPIQKCYEILKVSPDSDQDTVRLAYISLVKKVHPDSGCAEASAESFAEVDNAFRILQAKYAKERRGIQIQETAEVKEYDIKVNSSQCIFILVRVGCLSYRVCHSSKREGGGVLGWRTSVAVNLFLENFIRLRVMDPERVSENTLVKPVDSGNINLSFVFPFSTQRHNIDNFWVMTGSESVHQLNEKSNTNSLERQKHTAKYKRSSYCRK